MFTGCYVQLVNHWTLHQKQMMHYKKILYVGIQTDHFYHRKWEELGRGKGKAHLQGEQMQHTWPHSGRGLAQVWCPQSHYAQQQREDPHLASALPVISEVKLTLFLPSGSFGLYAFLGISFPVFQTQVCSFQTQSSRRTLPPCPWSLQSLVLDYCKSAF